MTATICEPTGRLTTGKCSESKWSNDFISLLLLVRSITFVFFMIREKKQSNYHPFIKTGPRGTCTSLVPWFCTAELCLVPLDLRALCLQLTPLHKQGAGMHLKTLRKLLYNMERKVQCVAIVFKKHGRRTLLKAEVGGILIYLQGPGCKHGAAITADLRPTSLPSSASPWTLPGVITFSVGERGFGYRES